MIGEGVVVVSVLSTEPGLGIASGIGKMASLAVILVENWQQKLDGEIEGGLDQLPSLREIH
jgi:hypothetical protein